MNSVALIVGGMLFGWFLEWLYVYVTKTAPKKDEVKQLKAVLQDSEHKQSEMSAEIEKLKAQVDELATRNKIVVAEADSLREELVVVQQSAEAAELESPESETTQVIVAETKEAESVDDMTRLAGVGPKTAVLLNKAGLVSFAQLAAMDIKSLQDFLRTNSIPHNKTKVVDWPEQAARFKSSLK